MQLISASVAMYEKKKKKRRARRKKKHVPTTGLAFILILQIIIFCDINGTAGGERREGRARDVISALIFDFI